MHRMVSCCIVEDPLVRGTTNLNSAAAPAAVACTARDHVLLLNQLEATRMAMYSITDLLHMYLLHPLPLLLLV
jgi:hypothetical protein